MPRSAEVYRFLRPVLQRSGVKSSYTRYFSAHATLASKKLVKESPTGDYERRVAQLQSNVSLQDCWPRLPQRLDVARISVNDLRKSSAILDNGASKLDDKFVVSGRVRSVRTAGSKLVFVDIEQDDHVAQAICNFSHLDKNGVPREQFNAFKRVVRRGDWYSFIGHPHKAQGGEESILATELPRLMSPSLHQIPAQLDDAETRARRPHVDMLVHRQAVQTLRIRSAIERGISTFFDKQGYSKVSTPLLTAGAGGAVARPFETVATEMQDTTLNLRIAPELWLKRLVVGGLGKVYEIGPAFRNEGVDATHNPEFTICESYMPFADLEQLMKMTEDLLSGLHEQLRELGEEHFKHLSDTAINFDAGSTHLFQGPFPRLPFISTIEKEMGKKLPNLSDDNAARQVLGLFTEMSIPLPAKPTLPRLLDALAGHYIEPLCTNPTFITEHPAVMSPLSKSYTCPTTSQLISARAELFIRGSEYANMYEEENSPFSQRENFVEQLKYREVDGEGDGRAEVDESYLEALEWGLPPTGGWGMGIDRLVMLFTGQKRIGDVLPFGTLRNVVGLAARQTLDTCRNISNQGSVQTPPACINHNQLPDPSYANAASTSATASEILQPTQRLYCINKSARAARRILTATLDGMSCHQQCHRSSIG
ncbi:lysyl-tRNA synthetase-like protein [Aureobasidium subglaciale]|nr:lysyl-tRNA synthetase-like protein [Aureobasidium subglaciale]